MEGALIILKLVMLFIAIFFTIVNSARVAQKLGVKFPNMLWQTIGIFGFVVIQFELYL